jgi:AraC-like DNA-binding protein
MNEPLEDVVGLLQPRAVNAKHISGAGRWAVRYADFGEPSFCVVLAGACRLVVDGAEPVTLQADDFVLLPRTPGFTLSGFEPAPPQFINPHAAPAPEAEVRHGTPNGPADVRLLGGFFSFDSPDAQLLMSLLPPLLQVRGEPRLATLVRLVDDEARAARAGRELVLRRLVEVLLVEALRAAPAPDAPPGLLRGLADERVARAMRCMHGEPAREWTVPMLADEAALSRSAFFERFTRAVGQPPMEYLLAWRMALAKRLLRQRELGIGDVAERVGYGSASTFSTAFSRHVGQPPRRYALQG